MPRPFVLLAVVAFTAVSVSPSSGGALVRDAPVSSGSEQLQFIFPDNIDCRDFERTAYKAWRLRTLSSVDLGNWDGSFWVSGAISRGLFVRRGFDLLDVLEAKCGRSAEARSRPSPPVVAPPRAGAAGR